MSKSLTELLQLFNIVTVMNVRVYKITPECFIKPGVLNLDMLHAYNANPLYLDTLTVSNIKTKGATKIFKSGLYNIPITQCGSTTTIDLKDALGRLDILQSFFNFNLNATNDRIYKTSDKNIFLALEGVIKILDATAQSVEPLYLFIPFFVPNHNFDIVSDTSNKFGVFDLSGNIYPISIEGTGITKHIEHYSLSKQSIFANVPEGISTEEQVVVHTILEPTTYTSPLIFDGDDVTINVQN